MGGNRGLGAPVPSTKLLWTPSTTESPEPLLPQPQGQNYAVLWGSQLSLWVRKPLGICPDPHPAQHFPYVGTHWSPESNCVGAGAAC